MAFLEVASENEVVVEASYEVEVDSAY